MFVVGLFFIAIFIILWDLLSNRKTKTQTRRIRICPKCKSKNVSPDFSRQTFGEQSEFNANKCNKCGYRGIFFPVISKKLIKKQK